VEEKPPICAQRVTLIMLVRTSSRLLDSVRKPCGGGCFLVDFRQA
jgi:hypothetical protein